MLSDADIAAMRATVNDALPDTAVIGRYTEVDDGAGGVTITYAPQPAVAGRLSPLSSRLRNAERIVAADVVSEAPWILTLPEGTVIGERDRVTVLGQVLEVSAVLDPMSWSFCTRVLCTVLR